MLQLDDFRVYNLDKSNITFDVYREVESKVEKNVEKKWTRVHKYYPTLEQCLEGIKNYIINNYYLDNITDYKELIEKINELHNSIVKCKLVGVECEKFE